MHATHLGSLGVTVYASVLIRRRGHSGKGRILIRQTIRVWHYHLATKLRRKAIKKRPKKNPPTSHSERKRKSYCFGLASHVTDTYLAWREKTGLEAHKGKELLQQNGILGTTY